MNWLVVLPIILILGVLYFLKIGILTWIFAWWLALWLFLSYGFSAPIPQSVVQLYMGIVTLVLIVYALSERQRAESFYRPLLRFAANRRYTISLIVFLVAIPALVGARVYLRMSAPVQAPFFARTVHPANPDLITVHEQEYNMITLDNPLRELETSDPEAFEQHLRKGAEIYFKNCFYCHGDSATGDGHLAYGLDPVPTDLKENIPQLQESFLFWRIAKGAPGLPDEGGPWESAMPAWENFLSEEEIWQVIAFIYDYTETRPRALHEVTH